jgi:topoisomerase-4 subunit A
MVKPQAGATFAGAMLGDPDDQFLLATDAGYGFVARLGDLHTKNRTGKAVLKVPKGARVLPPQPVRDYEEDWLAMSTTQGHFIVFMVGELPQLAKGKGVKMINIPGRKLSSREEVVAGVVVFQEGDRIRVYAGKRHLNMKPAEIDHYIGERALRGLLLPKGFRQVEALELEQK